MTNENTKTPEVGTLRELNVQPGDVVAHVNYPVESWGSPMRDRVFHIDEKLCAREKYGRAWFRAEAQSIFRIISRAPLPYGHARMPSGKVVDLTAITTPFGLLDGETQEAMRNHGGPYEYWEDTAWFETDGCHDAPRLAHRVKPKPHAPVVGEVVMTGWGRADGYAFGKMTHRLDTHRLTLQTRDGQLVPGVYAGPDGMLVKVEVL